MKISNTLFLLIAMQFSSSLIFAHDFEVGGIYYNITSSTNKTVEVVHRGSSHSSYSGEYFGAVKITPNVFYNEVSYSVKSIGPSAFRNCSSLTAVAIPNSVVSIGEGAFFGCDSLSSIEVDEGNDVYDSRNNCNAIIETSTNTLISGCKSTIIPNGVKSIGMWAFAGSIGLTSIVVSKGNGIYDSRNNCNAIIEKSSNTLILGCKNTSVPNGVISIGNGAFEGCSELTSLRIPNTVKIIGNRAFAGCSNLTSVRIGGGIEVIRHNAFAGCCDLKNIYVLANIPPLEVAGDAFCLNKYKITNLYVPEYNVSFYKSTYPWSDFSNIKAIPKK